ncbi:fibronectin type III domain-containing protein [Chryseobacterium sp. SSA4.19]|uniref:fibronectin type III domain-containing protein n=1 Tax=Chryseobacterium sp. SSA4.19 TaxID=2919915 RepID=UPI001F4E6DCD|nr:fibronectin type III domain-containing protein [Chryseobacterium sp. SSA4.19]MCJ8152191.1 fibronectin type III domain-containing protein [Chryseobacterium sp. SSA4.19]
MKKISTFLVLLLCLLNVGIVSNAYGQAPATLPYSQDFNTANDFTLVNGTLTNKWFYGTATGNPGSSIYISNNGGVDNAYDTDSESVVHAYRDFTIPAGSTVSTLSFDWKGEGESGYDFLRVWLVPDTFTPVAGDNITSGTDIFEIGQFGQDGSWQTYSNPAVDISAYAGSTMRLVFEWTNDTSFGTQPSMAVDNINIAIPSCIMPSAPAVSGVGVNTATLSWSAPSPVPGIGYEYYLSTTNTAPGASTPAIANAGTTVNLGSLMSGTTYYWWVRSICSASDTSIWVAGPSFNTDQIPATIPYTQDFTTGNDMQLENGTLTNKWFYGSATGNTGNSLYISDTDGTTNTYDTGSSSIVHAFRDIIVPAGTSDATLSFDWKGEGESNWDFLRVWMVPVTYVPMAGTEITAGGGVIQIGGNFNQQAEWQNYFDTGLDLSSFAGGTMRLVFEWTNDSGGGTQPPIAIDNINLSIPTCKVPLNIQVTSVGSNTASISWTAPVPAPVGGYQIYLSTTNVAPNFASLPTSTSPGTTAVLSPLTPNTTYYFWVRSVCAGSDRSFWIAGPSFTTSQIPATIPYLQQFNTGSDLGYTNGTQTNKWTYGNATGNTGNSLYISDTNGTTNTYDTGSSSIVHAYRDILVPPSTTTATFSYDWKAEGESNWDFLRVWLVPTTYMPTSGNEITAGTGRIQIGGNLNQQASWQTVLNPTLDISSFAGQTMRLVFEWTNDSGGGNQPPAAIDNINLRICSNATPVVTVGTPTYNSVVLTWNQDIGGATYTIRYRPVGSVTWQTVTVGAAAAPATTNTITLNGLLSATQYEVEVAAVCNGNAGNYSHSTFVTRCDPTPPNVTISNITTTSALVAWAPLAASSHYFMRYRIVGSGDAGWSTNIPLPAAPANTYPLNGLNVYTTYEVQIANMCDSESTLNTWSNPKVFTTQRTCDIAPPGLTITALTPTTAAVTWEPFPGAVYILRYRKVGIPSWTQVNSDTNTVMLSGLTELTQYEMEVVNVCGGTPGTYTEPYFFTTPTIVYCQMASTASAADYISKVTVAPTGKPEMENQSLGSNYTDYTGVTNKFIELIQGSSNNKITIEKKLSGNANAGVAVWIDFNRNGYFDINERILVSGSNNTETVSATFSVPADAFISMSDFKYVVMRVAMQKDGIPVNCTSFPNGEVEDYTVRISKPMVQNPVNQTEILIYPNPVKTVLNVKNISKRANYKIYNAAGQLVSSGIILNNKIDVHTLINGVYVIDIEDAQGAVQKKFIKE